MAVFTPKLNQEETIEMALEGIYVNHMRLFLSVAYYNYGLDRECAMDKLQAAFVKIWKNRHTIINRSDASLRNYSIRVFRNACIDHLRTIERNKLSSLDEVRKRTNGTHTTADTFSDSMSDPLNEILLIEELRLQKLAIERLPERYQDVMRLRLKGYKTGHIAKKLKIKYSTLKNLVTRGLEKFRRELESIEPDRVSNG